MIPIVNSSSMTSTNVMTVTPSQRLKVSNIHRLTTEDSPCHSRPIDQLILFVENDVQLNEILFDEFDAGETLQGIWNVTHVLINWFIDRAELLAIDCRIVSDEFIVESQLLGNMWPWCRVNAGTVVHLRTRK